MKYLVTYTSFGLSFRGILSQSIFLYLILSSNCITMRSWFIQSCNQSWLLMIATLVYGLIVLISMCLQNSISLIQNCLKAWFKILRSNDGEFARTTPSSQMNSRNIDNTSNNHSFSSARILSNISFLDGSFHRSKVLWSMWFCFSSSSGNILKVSMISWSVSYFNAPIWIILALSAVESVSISTINMVVI